MGTWDVIKHWFCLAGPFVEASLREEHVLEGRRCSSRRDFASSKSHLELYGQAARIISIG